MKGFVGVFMMSETKLDVSFLEGHFFIDDYHTLSGMTEMAKVVAFCFTSTRTYQQKSSTVIFQLPKVFLLKLIFIRKMVDKLFQ